MKVAPLSKGFMLTGIFGILIGIFYFDRFGPTWGTLILVFFAVIFIAALRSMTYGPVEAELKMDKK